MMLDIDASVAISINTNAKEIFLFISVKLLVSYAILHDKTAAAIYRLPSEKKSAATEVTAQKTQTPIVAKPTPQKAYTYYPQNQNLHFYQIHSMGEKGILSL